ncbi:MAG: sulfotransferase [Planctomycetota bacterium]|jgi:hypothetical protein
MYDDLKHFCTFIGYTRSGHSFVGALMDAHRNVLIAHELDVFGRLEGGGCTGGLRYDNRIEMFDAVTRKSRAQAEAGRAGSRIRSDGSEYRVSYEVPGQYQGRFTMLRVLGNKRGQVTAKAIAVNRDVLRLLQEQAELPVKLIHVVRNPFDNIATMTPIHKERSIRAYFSRAEQVAKVKADGWDLLDIYLEDLIDEPETELRRICAFLEVEPLEDYLRACAGIVMKTPNETRVQRDWTRSEIKAVRKRIAHCPWLDRYALTEVTPALTIAGIRRYWRGWRSETVDRVRDLLGSAR